jgi:hypothetical protein
MKKTLNLITEALIYCFCRAIVSFLWLSFFVVVEAILIFNPIAWYYHLLNFSLIAFFFYCYLKNNKIFYHFKNRKI